MQPFKVFSTFTGIGGFELGIRNATSRPIQFVGYSEIDKYAVSVYEKHFKGVKNYGDITKIKAEELPDFDCLVGGFPCQAFSVAGQRKGFADTRGTLFFDLARILQAKRPKLFVFENVKGLLNHDSGNTFRTILKAVADLGYDCQWQVLNSKNHGVPQNRERIIIVGYFRNQPRPEIFLAAGQNQAPFEAGQHEQPAAEKFIKTRHLSQNGRLVSDSTTLQASEIPHILVGSPKYKKGKRSVDYKLTDTAPTIRATQHKSGDNQPKVVIGTLRTHKDGEGFRSMKSGVAPTLPARARNDGSGQPVVMVEDTKKAYALTATDYKRTGTDFVHKHKGNFGIIGGKIRRLTPVECERLQAFPDDWTKYGADGQLISDTQRYKMCGNAVTTNVIQAVFEQIFNYY